jgi:excinuclease UvrABC nuclease subunit
VYLGRTKQPLQDRIRGHLFKKPMHRSININLVTKIEYALFKTEADMNLYEIYLIILLKPPLNVDDKTNDSLTVTLPEIEFTLFNCHLWDKWIEEINNVNSVEVKRQKEQQERFDKTIEMRKKWHSGEISEDEYYGFKEAE